MSTLYGIGSALNLILAALNKDQSERLLLVGFAIVFALWQINEKVGKL